MKSPGYGKMPVGVMVSSAFLLLVLVCLLFPDLLAASPLKIDTSLGAVPAGSPGHVLGTDSLGRDVLDLTIRGTRSALLGPLAIALGSIVIGLVLGSLAGWFGGVPDWIISRYADITLSMPTLLLAIVAASILGGGYWVSVAVMIILYSPFDIRLVRSAVIAQKNKPYIESALILRLGTPRILAVHIFPNIAHIILVNFFLNIAAGLVSMSSLSYLGLGVAPGDADWGRQLADGKGALFDNPMASVTAGLAIIITAIAVNVVGNYFSERTTIG
ncbi:MAG: ABC transporter permease [Clostridiales Family XIII bacterium]|jgi:peptide/nickel transport system permease protein|nr:ABC transporter permease [Clostridiales Family XIII bacterium]